MKKKYVAATLLSALICNPFNTAVAKSDVAAKVSGEKLTVAELKDAYDNAAPEFQQQVTFEQFYPRAVMNWVNSRALYNAGIKDNIKSTKEYKDGIKNIETELVTRLYLKKNVFDHISDKEVKAAYDTAKANFKSEKEIAARHILVDDETTAKDIIAKLKKGTKFDELAKYSKDSRTNLGYFRKNMMVPEFGDAVFKMKKGEYNKTPIKTEFGYHVVMVDDVRDSKMPAYEEVAGQIKGAMAEQKTQKLIEELLAKEKITVYDVEGKVVNFDKPADK